MSAREVHRERRRQVARHGRLTNQITVIIGYCHLLLAAMAEGDERRPDVVAILAAARTVLAIASEPGLESVGFEPAVECLRKFDRNTGSRTVPIASRPDGV